MKNALLLFFLACCALPATATFYFIDPYQGVDSHTRLQAQSFYYPWRHIQTGIDSASAGDTLLISAGNFDEQLLVKKRLVFLGENRDVTTIRFPATLSFGPCVTIAPGVDNVYFSDLTINGAPTATSGATDGILCGVGVDGLTLHRVGLVNCIGTGLRTTSDATPDGKINDGFSIDSCVFQNIQGGRSGNQPSCAFYGDHVAHLRFMWNAIRRCGMGLWLGGTAFPDTSGGTGNFLRNNVMQDLSQNALVAQWQSNTTVDSNIFRRCAAYAAPESAWSAAFPGTVCFIGQARNNVFRNNIVRDNGGILAANTFYTNPISHLLEGPGYSGWPAIFIAGDADLTIRFNTIFNNVYGGIFISGAGSYTITDNYLYSNGELNAANRDYGLAAPLATVTAGSNWWGLDDGPGYDGNGLRNGVMGAGVNTSVGGVRRLTGRNSFDLKFNPARIIYNIVHVGNHQDTTCLFYNAGVGPAFTAAPFIGGASSQFAVLSPTAGQIIQPGDSIRLTVRFAPTQLGLLRAQALVAPDTVDQEVGPLLLGFGGLAVLSAIDTLRFDTLAPGRCAEKTIMVQNTGTEALHVGAAAIVGLDSAEYTLVDPMPLDLAPNSSQLLHIRFCPTRVAESRAQLIFSANTQPLTTIVEIRGSSATVSRLHTALDSLAIGLIRVGLSRDTSIFVHNTARVPLSIDSVRFENDLHGEVTLLSPLPAAINPGFSTVLQLHFAPTVRSVKQMVLRATASDGTTFSMPVSAAGGIYQMTKSAESLFDTVTVPVGSVLQECVTIRNTGEFKVGVFLTQLSGDNSDQYLLGAVPQGILAPGIAETLCVQYRPVRTGRAPEQVLIQYSEGTMGLDSIALNGNSIRVGIDAAAAPGNVLLVTNYPDPFAGNLGLRVESASGTRVIAAALYDALGRQVLDLTRAFAGDHNAVVTVDASALPAGMYVLRVTAGASTVTRVMRKI